MSGRSRRPLKLSTRCWAICQGRAILIWTVSGTKRAAIQSVEKNWSRPWKRLKQEGCVASKVSVITLDNVVRIR
jgi:hypothetical protein